MLEETHVSETEIQPNSFLTRFGGWLLLLAGVVQLVLAVWLRSAADVAPVFAVFGAACVVLAVVLERIEGPLEVGPRGLRTSLREVARSRVLSGTEAGAALELVADELASTSWRTRGPEELAQRIAREASERAALDRAEAWLQTDGWTTERMDPHGFPYDLYATRGDERLYLDVKASLRPLDAASIQRAIDLSSVIPSVVRGETRYGIYAATPGVEGDALMLARQAGIGLWVEQQPFTVQPFA